MAPTCKAAIPSQSTDSHSQKARASLVLRAIGLNLLVACALWRTVPPTVVNPDESRAAKKGE